MSRKRTSTAPRTGTSGAAPHPSPHASAAGGDASRVLYALLACSLLLSVFFALRVPFGVNPDETAHFDYVRLLIQNHSFVKFVPVPFDTVFPPNVPTPWETHQPPLYYLLCLPVYLATGGSVFAIRLVAAVLQLATIWVAFRAGRTFFPDRPEVAVGLAAFVALLPSQAQLGAAISNDSLTTLLCTAMFWRIGLLVSTEKAHTWRDAAVIGALFGVGLLTKLSVFQIAPAIVVAYLFAAKQAVHRSTVLVQGVSALGIGLLIALPWLVRNTMLYGDPLALSIYKLTGPNYTPQQIIASSRIPVLEYIRFVTLRSFTSFWYILDPNLPLGNRFAGPPLPLVLVVVLGLGGAGGTYQWQKTEAQPNAIHRVLILYTLAIIVILPFYLQFQATVFQVQGRYFLPVLLPIAFVATVGWVHLLARRGQWAGTILIAAALFALTMYQLTTF